MEKEPFWEWFAHNSDIAIACTTKKATSNWLHIFKQKLNYVNPHLQFSVIFLGFPWPREPWALHFSQKQRHISSQICATLQFTVSNWQGRYIYYIRACVKWPSCPVKAVPWLNGPHTEGLMHLLGSCYWSYETQRNCNEIQEYEWPSASICHDIPQHQILLCPSAYAEKTTQTSLHLHVPRSFSNVSNSLHQTSIPQPNPCGCQCYNYWGGITLKWNA